MATVKRIDGDYTIVTLNESDRVTVDTHTFEVRGNLDVAGNLTYINVTELNVKDPFVLLNSSDTSTYSSNAGILTHKTDSDYAGLRYNNVSGQWEISNSTGTNGNTGLWEQIATAGLAASAPGNDTEIIFNQSGNLSASSGLTYDYTESKMSLQGYQVLGNIGTEPSASVNSVTIYHNEVGSGGTGIYAKTPTTNDELVSRSKAIVFGLIF